MLLKPLVFAYSCRRSASLPNLALYLWWVFDDFSIWIYYVVRGARRFLQRSSFPPKSAPVTTSIAVRTTGY